MKTKNSYILTLSILILLGLAACTGKTGNEEASSGREIEVLETIPVIQKKDSTVPEKLTAALLPEEFGHKGTFFEAWQWYDLNGKNILILSIADKKEKDKEGEETKTRELFGKQYVVPEAGAKPEILWELYDIEKSCPYDITAEYLFSPIFMDLDNNKVKESYILYKLACRSDVSPARMKIVVHEGKNKYALRGEMYMKMNPKADTLNTQQWEPDLSKVKVNKDDYTSSWGRFENANDFAGAPKAFFEQAKELWLENFIEN